MKITESLHIVEQKVAASIRDHCLLSDGARVLVATSGGADSVALLSALHTLGYECVVAHCNFHLRGEESNRDEAFVCNLAAQLGTECEVIDFDTLGYAKETKQSVEMACRELRYRWFANLASQKNCEAIAVAHHCDDNVETFFLNLFRGTGIAGLRGMLPRNGNVVRPMLSCSRAEIEDYLASKSLEYVTDSTNLECDYSRNKVRNILLPFLKEFTPAASQRVAMAMENLQSTESLFRALLSDKCSQVLKQMNRGVSFDIADVLNFGADAEAFLFELLKDFHFNAETRADLLHAMREGALSQGKQFYSISHVAVIERGAVEITDLATLEVREPMPLSGCARVDVSCVEGDASEALKMCDGKHVIALSIDAPLDALMVRPWCEADRLSPFGMHGSKLVSDLLSDAKLSFAQKHGIDLLTTADGKVLWVMGIRASRHFAVKKGDTKFYVLKLKY